MKKAISKEDIQRTDSGSGTTPRPSESRRGSGDIYGPRDYYREHPHDYRMQGEHYMWLLCVYVCVYVCVCVVCVCVTEWLCSYALGLTTAGL